MKSRLFSDGMPIRLGFEDHSHCNYYYLFFSASELSALMAPGEQTVDFAQILELPADILRNLHINSVFLFLWVEFSRQWLWVLLRLNLMTLGWSPRWAVVAIQSVWLRQRRSPRWAEVAIHSVWLRQRRSPRWAEVTIQIVWLRQRKSPHWPEVAVQRIWLSQRRSPHWVEVAIQSVWLRQRRSPRWGGNT